MLEITVGPSGGINSMLLSAAWWNNHAHTFTLVDEGAGVDLCGFVRHSLWDAIIL